MTTASATIADKTYLTLYIIASLGKARLFTFDKDVHGFFFCDGSGNPITAQTFSNMVKGKADLPRLVTCSIMVFGSMQALAYSYRKSRR